MSKKKRPVSLDDEDYDQDVSAPRPSATYAMPAWSFGRAPLPPPRAQPPLPQLRVDDADEQAVMSRAWDSLTHDEGSSLGMLRTVD
jgi:hypothetical protein